MSGNYTLYGGISNETFEHQCRWQLTVTYTDDKKQTVTTTVGYPLTINFNIQRDTFASSNRATFEIINLAPGTRQSNAFFQDKFNTNKLKIVTFSAGYKDNLIECFKGYILESYTERQGVDVITRMQCLDLGTNATNYINITIEAGTTRQEAYNIVLQNCKNLTAGKCGVLEGVYETPITISGTPLEALNQITEGHTFIDNGVVNTLNNNESLDIGVQVLSPYTGLLGTPQRRDTQIIVESLLNPSIMVGQLLDIQDPVFTDFNGTYYVCGFNHSGTISATVGGQRRTVYNLLIGAYMPESNYSLTTPTQGTKAPKNFYKVTDNQKIEPVNGVLEEGAIGIYNYIQSHNGSIPNLKITKNISADEMFGHSNNDNDRLTELDVTKISNAITIAKKLQTFIDSYVPGAILQINSGWRSTRNNSQYKNASKESAHLRGSAIDFRISNMNTLNIYSQIFNKLWDKFTYLFRPSVGSIPVIHVQSTLGKGDAKRSTKSIV